LTELNYDYYYEDKEQIYVQSNGVLKNKLNIVKQKQLIETEAYFTAKRIAELKENSISIKTIINLLDYHQYIFQDMYDWAGQIRTVGIRKDGNKFSPISEFPERQEYIDKLIQEYKTINSQNKYELAEKLAVILDEINWMHPFREGNGRTHRCFIEQLAKDKKYDLDLCPTSEPEIYKEYMEGTINGALGTLTHLINNNMQPQNLKSTKNT
jgi:cell filamentation protein